MRSGHNPDWIPEWDLVYDLPPVKYGRFREFGVDWSNSVDFSKGQTDRKCTLYIQFLQPSEMTPNCVSLQRNAGPLKFTDSVRAPSSDPVSSHNSDISKVQVVNNHFESQQTLLIPLQIRLRSGCCNYKWKHLLCLCCLAAPCSQDSV